MLVKLPSAAKLPFVPSSVALAIRRAKQLRLQFPSLSLGRARETYARVVAFKDWHAMEQALAAGQQQGVTDDLLTSAGLRARRAWQIQAASRFAEIPEEEIASFLEAWNPTGPARTKASVRTVSPEAKRQPVKRNGPLWERAQTYHEALQLEGLSPEQRFRLELMPWPSVRLQFKQMAEALEAESGLSSERCRQLTARVIDRNLPDKPAKDFMRIVEPPTPLGDVLLEAALDKFEAIGVYQALVPPHHTSGLVAKLREAAEWPEISAFARKAEGWYSSDIGIGIHNFLASTLIPERIELAGAEQLMWLDKAWHTLKAELGDSLGALAWSAMTGLPTSGLQYVRDWVANTPGRIKGSYSITDEQYSKGKREFEGRVRAAGIFAQEPLAQETTTFSRWLRPAELSELMAGIDKNVVDHGPFAVSMHDALNVCRDANAAIQLSMTMARVNVGDVRIIYVHSIACDAGEAKKLFRAGWPFPYLAKLDDEVGDVITSQANVRMSKEAHQLLSRKSPERLK